MPSTKALDDLVGAPPTGDPRVHLSPIRRDGMTFLPLTRRAGGVQAFKMIISARRESARSEPQPQKHEGYEWLYVHNGRLRLVLGDQDLVLPHCLGTADNAAVELLILSGPQSERAHVRARPT